MRENKRHRPREERIVLDQVEDIIIYVCLGISSTKIPNSLRKHYLTRNSPWVYTLSFIAFLNNAF